MKNTSRVCTTKFFRVFFLSTFILAAGNFALAAEVPPQVPSTSTESSAPPPVQPSTPTPFEVRKEVIQKILARGVPLDALTRSLRFMSAYMERKFVYRDSESASLINRTWMAIIDYTQPSVNYRFFLINLVTGNVERYLVAHARNSGDKVATDFGNVQNSNKTSLGIYLTGRSYASKKFGTGRILYGVETTNDQAHARGVVMHGATYMSQNFIRNNGRAGRSQGCPALEKNSFKRVHSLLGVGAVLFHYHSKLPANYLPSKQIHII